MLSNQILFGVAPLILLLMMIGGDAVWLFVRLGGAPSYLPRHQPCQQPFRTDEQR